MKIFRLFVVLIVLGAIVVRLAGIDLGQSLLWVAGIAELTLMCIVGVGLLRVWAKRRGSQDGQTGGWPEELRTALHKSLPPWAADAVIGELQVMGAFLRSITFRRIRRSKSRPGVQTFSVMKESKYPILVWVLIFVLAVEAPAVHMVLGEVMSDGRIKVLIRGALMFSTIYFALWLVGDRRLLLEGHGVVLQAAVVEFDLGMRCRGVVQRETIESCQLLGGLDHDEDENMARGIRITPIDEPNLRLHLTTSVDLQGIYGIPMHGRTLDLYVDEPERLRAALGGSLSPHGGDSPVSFGPSLARENGDDESRGGESGSDPA